MGTAGQPTDDTAYLDPAELGEDATAFIKLLGPLVLSIAGRQATPRGARERKLLALLALNANTIVTTERIVDALWEDPPSSARQQIHNVVGALRRTLAPAVGMELVTDGSGYQLFVRTEDMDALRFRSAIEEADAAEQQGRLEDAIRLLGEALSLWRGTALSGLDGRVLTNAATQLDTQRLAAVERLAELRLRTGRAALALDGLASILAENPLRETLRALLMTALFHCGRQSEAMAVFEEGRQLLAEELGLDPGPQLREAHQRILRGGTEVSVASRALQPGAERARRGQPGESVNSRSFLPRDIPEFTGREAELRRLRDRPSGRDTPVVSVIDGMGGVGKTSLAVHLAHHLAERYPDGQYFVDLAGFSDQAKPMSPLQALNLLLRLNGMAPELIAPDLEARSAQWRSCVAGRRVLILLDNAADPSQLRPLLPGSPGSMVLISSRRRMAELEGSVALSLDVMTESDAIALFCRVAGPERVTDKSEAVRAAVELCGYLPLAIQIAAARLRERSSWQMSFLVDQLRVNESRARILAAGDRDVMTIIAWSYRHLTDQQQRLLGLLSLHAGPDFDAYATAALAGLPIHEVEVDLDKLFELNLLKQHVADRYHLHDLVRDCARKLLNETLDEGEVAEAVGRLSDYFLWSADDWCRQLARTSLPFVPKVDHRPKSTRSAADIKHAVSLLEAEFDSIVATLHLAADLRQHTRVWQTMTTLRPYFSALNYPVESAVLFELGRLAARADESLIGEAACLSGLAETQLAHGTLVEATKLSERALELSRQCGDRFGEVSQQNSLGRIHWAARNLDKAGERYRAALRVARELEDLQLQATLTNNLAIISREQGSNDEALRYFVEARSLGEGSLSPSTETHILNNTGLVSALLGDWQGATAIYRHSLELSRAAGVEHGEVLALVGLCIVSRGMGRSGEAFAHGRAALELARRISMYEGEAQALNALGDIHVSDGELELAEQVFQQCLYAASSRDSARYVARAHEGLAHVASSCGDVAKAVEHWGAALLTSPGVVDAPGARRHLALPGARASTCWRCVTVGYG